MTPTLGRRATMKLTGMLALLGLASSANAADSTNEALFPWDGDDGDGYRRGPDELGRARFAAEIAGETLSGWKRIKLPAGRTATETYREGDDADAERQIWGQTSFDDLEMERGVKPGDTRLHDWHMAVRRGDADAGRKELSVVLLGETGEPQIRWEFAGAWVKSYSPPELDASADGDVATESVTVAFDRMIRTEV